MDTTTKYLILSFSTLFVVSCSRLNVAVAPPALSISRCNGRVLAHFMLGAEEARGSTLS